MHIISGAFTFTLNGNARRYLIEYGVFWTDKTPSKLLTFAIGIGNWQANVEYLAIIFDVSIITVGFANTRETVRNVASN